MNTKHIVLIMIVSFAVSFAVLWSRQTHEAPAGVSARAVGDRPTPPAIPVSVPVSAPVATPATVEPAPPPPVLGDPQQGQPSVAGQGVPVTISYRSKKQSAMIMSLDFQEPLQVSLKVNGRYYNVNLGPGEQIDLNDVGYAGRPGDVITMSSPPYQDRTTTLQ